MQPQDAGPLGVHFQKLLSLKDWIKQEAEKSKDPIVMEIYERLNTLIKKEENTNE